MPGILPDGTVLPSYLSPGWSDSAGPAAALMDATMRLGEVVEAYAPASAGNKDPNAKPRQWVYVVNTVYRDANGARQLVPYRCVVGDLFGGMADHLRYTMRMTDAKQESGEFGKGSMVVVMCPNGDKSEALIVGGVRHPKDDKADPGDTFLDFAFNGVHFSIDKDGAMVLEVPGATKLDGSPGDRDGNNKGSKVTFAKNGDITIDDKAGDSIKVSPGDKTVSVAAEKCKTEAGSSWTVKAQTVKVEATMVEVKAEMLTLGGTLDECNPLDGVVVGTGVDTFTGVPYALLGNTAPTVIAKKT